MQMGRLIRLRPRRSSLYAVKETVAALNEELEFTLNYAHAMTKERNYRAAAEVIEEQRSSLARAARRMENVVVEPERSRSRLRVRAAMVGVAATFAIASGAVAGFNSARAPAENPRIQAMQQAKAALNSSAAISDPDMLQAIVIDAQQTILDAALAAPSDPTVKAPLLETIANLRQAIKNPNVPARVREQAKQVAEQVQQIVVEVPDDVEAETEEPSTEPATPPTTTP